MYDVDDGFPNTAPVGSFPKGASRYGVEDVVGNVWEWVADWYGAVRARTRQNDPEGPGERATSGSSAAASWNGVVRRVGAADVPLPGRADQAQLRHRLPLRPNPSERVEAPAGLGSACGGLRPNDLRLHANRVGGQARAETSRT